MKSLAKFSGRLLITGAMLVCAAIFGMHMWNYYMESPWTRDGHVRADVIGVAPDVSGLVAKVLVKDDQMVKAGDVLFQIDPQRFKLAVDQADAEVHSARAALSIAEKDAHRYARLGDQHYASEMKVQTAQSTMEQAQAALNQALANRELAKLNLDRTSVRAAVSGKLTNFSLRPGDYASAGKAVAALVDSASVYVAGYFEETKLDRIHVGDPVKITFMGSSNVAHGRVQSIAGGIQDSERSDTSGGLANVSPTFNWVRLAQRVPVRVSLDEVPDAIELVPGRTVTVEVLPRDDVDQESALPRQEKEHSLAQRIKSMLKRV